MTIDEIDQSDRDSENDTIISSSSSSSSSLSNNSSYPDLYYDIELLSKATKRININTYLLKNDRIALKSAAFSCGGFINNDLRLLVWPKLINIDQSPLPSKLSKEIIKSNEWYHQVILDVDRSLKRFPPSVHEEKRILYQDSLTKVIIRVLCCNPSLHYYQGYHDVCLTFLLMMDEENAFKIINKISNTHLKYFMEETMNTTSNLLEIIYLILKDEDLHLYNYLIMSEVGTIFSLSWVITWFSHVLNDFNDIARLFDFFISSHFLMPIYLTVSILLYKKKQIHNIDCDMANMHQYLTGLPQNETLPFDKLVMDTLHLSTKYPPEDTLQRQNEIKENALKGDNSRRIFKKNFQFIPRNMFSITLVVLVGGVIYQIYSEYSK